MICNTRTELTSKEASNMKQKFLNSERKCEFQLNREYIEKLNNCQLTNLYRLLGSLLCVCLFDDAVKSVEL